MPRKKSAAKKAKEAAKRAQLEQREPEKQQAQKATLEQAKRSTSDEEYDESSSSRKQDSLSDIEHISSSSEDEDDFGELITEEVEDGIKKVLEAIKSNDNEKLLNPNVKFFEDAETAAGKFATKEKHKPIYLKDYHRINLLSGNAGSDDEEFETVDGQKSYAVQQREERTQLLNEINNAVKEAASDEEDEFLTKKEVIPVKETTKSSLPDPNVNDEQFLEEFINQKAWIPKKGDKMIDVDRVAEIQEDDEEFENAVEQFETAYNFRYEDPNSAEIVSYARNQATLRRSATSARRRKREEEKQAVNKDKQEKEKAVQKKKTETVHQLSDVLERVKEEYGAEINEKRIKKLTDTLLNGDFDDKKWDQVVGAIFNEEYYQKKGKPKWDEDEDIVYNYEEDQHSNDDTNIDDDESEEPAKKKSRKEKIDEKKSQKREKRALTEMIEKAVEQNKLALVEKVEEERGRSNERDTEMKFRYREISPESFGLTTREIFAADDAELNQFIGLRKFAPYRPKELRHKDKRKVMKSKRLKEWRKQVFNSEDGLQGDELEFAIFDKETKHMKHTHKKHTHKKRNQKEQK